MEHEQLKQKVFAFYDGELPIAERPGVESHLRDCAECRSTLESWKAISRTFFASQTAASSEEFVAKVMARLETPAPATSWLDWLRWVTPAAGLAGLAVFLTLNNPLAELTPATSHFLLASSDRSPILTSLESDDEPEPEELVALNLEAL